MARHHVEASGSATSTWRQLAFPFRQPEDVPSAPPTSTSEVQRQRAQQAAAQQAGPAQQLALQPQLTWQQRFTAAAGASIVSALVVNPLDVVKTRMQARAMNIAAAGGGSVVPQPSRLLDKWGICSSHPPSCPACDGGPAAACVRGGAESAAGAAAKSPSTLELMRSIARSEGPMALWRGTGASLLMAVPMVGIYFPLYDALAERLSHTRINGYAPLVAGGTARTIAVLCTSPLELVRTRMQAALHLPPPAGSPAAVAAAAGGPRPKPPGMWAHLPDTSSAGMRGRVAALWTGAGATLARDVPFSALYWQLLEPIRQRLLPHDGHAPSRGRVITVNLIAGSTAGAIAAAVTTPLDVVKTRAQLRAGSEQGRGGGIVTSLREIAREGGVPALFSGVAPRAARAAPACAIVVASYEAIKTLYAAPPAAELPTQQQVLRQ